MVDPISGTVSSWSALRIALKAVLPSVAMQHDIFQHHDGIIDDQPNRRGQPAQRHQIETLPCHLRTIK